MLDMGGTKFQVLGRLIWRVAMNLRPAWANVVSYKSAWVTE